MRMRSSPSRGRPSTTRWAARRPAGRVGQHSGAAVGAPQLQLGARAVHHVPRGAGNGHSEAVRRAKDAVLQPPSGAAGEDAEGDGRDERRAPGAGAHALASRSRALPVSARQLLEDVAERDATLPSNTSVWNQRSATSETTRASPSPPSAAVTTSIASSPILRHTAASPFASRPATYEPDAGADLRSPTMRSMRSSMFAAAPGPDSALKKHVRAPVWQATPSWWTWTTSVSPSQSA